MALHAEPVSEILRIQDRPGAYAWGEPFDAVLTVIWIGRVAHLAGLHGRMSRRVWREIHDYLVAAGATRAEAVHCGRERTYERRSRP